MTRADKRKFHYVYRIDRDDGKFYIGMHSTDLMEDGYFGSGTYLSNSLRYHGKDKHTKTILAFFETRQEAKDHEKFLITDEMRSDRSCMNLAPGGGGGFATKQQQQNASISGNRSANRNHAAATAKAIQTKRERGTMFIPTGSSGMLGKTHRTETKRLQSQSHTGEKNSQYGTCWVTDGTKPVKIKKELLDEYLARGFVQGRKLHHPSSLAN